MATSDNLPRPNCDGDGKAQNMRQRTVVWLIYHQSECQEEVIFVNFPCASEVVSRQGVSVDPPELVALARRVVFIYATPHNSWETLGLGCPSNSLIYARFTSLVITTFIQTMTHLVFPLRILHNQCFQIRQGITVVPREIENNGYVKFWGGKQGELWSM